jgi:PAS domain S-box-containing protein
MPSSFIENQIDYILFVYGLAFLILAAVCYVMRLPATQRLPWRWLALFGVIHGAHEWLDMAIACVGDSYTFALARLILLAVSFVCLIEFGRLGSVSSRNNPIGGWIHMPLAAAVFSVYFLSDLPGLNASIRYAFGLTGGFWAAWTLMKGAKSEKVAPRPLAVMAAAMAVYAVAAGFIVPETPFFPASVVNYAAFLAWTGIPIQLARGVIAVVIAAAVWHYCEGISRRRSIVETGRDRPSPYGFHLTVALLSIVTAGWVFTEWVARDVEAEARSRATILAKTAVVGIDLEQVQRFAASQFDTSHPDYERLRRQLTHIQQVDPWIRHLHLTFWKAGKGFELLDANSDLIGQKAERHLSSESSAQALLHVFGTGEAGSIGRCHTSSGYYFFGFAPVLASGSDQPIAVLAVDIDAGEWWQQKIAAYRMMPIGIVLLISLIAILFFFSRQGIWEQAQCISIRERQLAGAQRLAHIGSWTHDLITDRIAWSEEMYRICGIEPRWDDQSRTSLEYLLPFATLVKLRTIAQEAIDTKKGCEAELHVVRPDRTERHIAVRAEPKLTAAGEVIQVYGTAQDITEQKKVLSELRKLTIAIEQSPTTIIITDRNGRIEYVNPKFTQLTGYTIEEAKGQNPRILKSEKMTQEEYAGLWRTILSGKEWRGEFYNKKKNGEHYWERAVIAPVTDGDGAITHFIAVKEDINEYKRVEAEREKALQEVQDLYDKAPCGYHSLDVKGFFVRINDTELSWLGYTREELLGKMRFADLLTSKSRELFQRNYLAFLEIGWVQDLEFDMVRKDGSVMPVILNASAVKDAEGNYLMSRTTIFDITDRKWTERALQESESKVRLILDSTAEGIYGVDINGRCTFCNPASLRLLAYQRTEQVVGKNAHELVHHSHADGAAFPWDECPIKRTFDREERVHVESDVFWRANGTCVPVEYWSYPQYRDGDFVGAVVTFIDITKRKKALDALQQAHDDLERANRELARVSNVKSRFLATVSHEIRTPLNAIISLTAMMLDTRLDADQRESIETIQASSEVLLVLINDVLDFSKIEAEKMELEQRVFDMRRCIREAVDMIRGLAAEKHLLVVCQPQESLPQFFVGDTVRLRQILVNLLNNAVKFTEQGSVSVSVSVQPRGGDQSELHFMVRDTGIGIPPDRQDRLFQSFSQMDASTHRQFGGTGLGLVISKQLCELMGGRMWVQSEGIPGLGSTFHFTIVLPLGVPEEVSPETTPERTEQRVVQEAAPQAATAAGAAPPRPLRILLAEDNPINQKVTVKMLGKMGYQADVANDGVEAVRAVERGHYDVVLMDCLMPKLDGYEATRQIREMERATGRPPTHIVAMTASVMQGDREACLAAGMNEYLSKPVRNDALLQLLERRRPIEPTEGREAAHAAASPMVPPTEVDHSNTGTGEATQS